MMFIDKGTRDREKGSPLSSFIKMSSGPAPLVMDALCDVRRRVKKTMQYPYENS